MLMRALVTEQFKMRKQSLKLRYPNHRMSLMVEALENWWKKIDPALQLFVPVQSFADFMQKKGIVGKSHDTPRMIKKVIGDKMDIEGTIYQSQFMRIFQKVLVRSALTNVLYFIKKISNRDGTDTFPADPVVQTDKTGDEQPLLRKADANHILYLLKLQRTLALSCLKPDTSMARGFDAENVVDAVIK